MILNHSNISIRLPREHAELITAAAINAREELSKWVADRATKAAAAELGVPVPAPAMPSRDRIRQAARAAGLSEEAFKAQALVAAVERVAKTPSERPPAMERPASKSGEFKLDLTKQTPAQAVRDALAAGARVEPEALSAAV